MTASFAPVAVDQAGWAARKRALTLANGVTLRYVEAGDPAGAPLLLLHGWTDSSRSWSLLVPELARFRLIIPDLRGHGASDRPERYALGDFAEDVRLLLDALGIDRTAIAGHSLGSFVAQRVAFEAPARVERLVLVGSTAAPAITPDHWLWHAVMALDEPIAADDPFIAEWVSGVAPVDAGFLAAVRAETIAVPRRVWRGVAVELATTELSRIAAHIRTPVLIVWGDADPLFDAESQAALRRLLPQARFHALPGLGHNTHWEAPREIAVLIAGFVAPAAGAPIDAPGDDGRRAPAPANAIA